MKRFFLLIILPAISFINIQSQTQTEIEWATLGDSPWPMIKHDPQFTGRSPYKGPQTPTIVWTEDMPDGIFSGPVIGEEGNLYFGSYYQLDSADHFYSYTADGNFRWDYTLGNNRPPQSGVLVDSSNTVYFGSLDGYLYALNSDGTLKWKYYSGLITEVVIPNIDLEGKIYVTNNPEGELVSINPDGTLNWKVKYDEGFIQKSPVFSPDGQTIYIFGFHNNLYAINLDGSLKWKFNCGLSQKAPAIDNEGNLYFLPEEVPQKLYSLKPDGTIRWEVTLINSSYIPTYSAPAIDSEGNIYIALGSAIMSYTYEGEYRWWYIIGTNPDEYDDFWQPLICDSEGTVYVGSTFGYYYYAISSEGELKWKLPLNGYQVDNTGAIAEDGTLYLGVHKSSLGTNQDSTLIAIRDTNTTAIREDKEVSVSEYRLYQNYPNPFNPSTNIIYQIPQESRVIIKLYDVLGREIRTLVNEYKNKGRYNLELDGSELSSGIYIYRITAGEFSASKKLVLMK
ncbi:MAG: PQQ-binding-like beta-propeller repeat protein [Melioribacteraceae bacterium]|nr:PQQ-binding-like beta-propeller repeat protein [Melioribacteraceae bacterium]MCF8421196.1 PQQ-binding-like beta-propeller repeat protein [Melioribacteraceae bacterium]